VPPCLTLSRCAPLCRGVHGRIADGVHAIRTVGAHRRLFHGRPRTGRAGGVFPGLTRGAESGVHPRVPVRRPGDSAVRRAGKGGCADGQGGGSGERDGCGAGGAGAGRPRVRGRVLGLVHPCGDVAVLLVNRELSGNSVQHSARAIRERRSRSRSGPGKGWSRSRSGPGSRPACGRPSRRLPAGRCRPRFPQLRY
jgi:hypothetical protein